MTARTELPSRRPHFVEPFQWGGASWLLGVGLDEDGIAKEVFADPADEAVEVDAAILTLVHEASITVSHLLQHGVPAAVHAQRLAGNAPGMLATMLARAAAIENEHGDQVRALHRWRAERLAREAAAEATS